MYNLEYEAIIGGLTQTEKELLVKALDQPVKTVPATASKLIAADLIAPYDGGSYTTSDLGYEVATYVQSQFTYEESEEVYDANRLRWRIVFDIVMPRPYGSFMATEQFKDHVFLSEAIESKAVSSGHSIIRARYPTASRIRAFSREVFQLPKDEALSQPVEFVPLEE